jgi:hypothetical protein
LRRCCSTNWTSRCYTFSRRGGGRLLLSEPPQHDPDRSTCFWERHRSRRPCGAHRRAIYNRLC